MNSSPHATKDDIRALATLIEQVGESLQQEMAAGFDRLDAATKRNTGMIVSGTFAVGALKKWAAKQDVREKKQEEEIRTLRARVSKLERTLKGRKTA